MDPSEVFKQLKERRVIRTVVIYIALLWVALQAADLFASADIISEDAVRWLIALGAIGLPLVLAGSWFLDAPWQKRRWTSLLGDMAVIVAIAIAAFLFAWQQWFTSFMRPVVAVLAIEATDTREDTQALANHLAGRFRMLLATRAELRVLELSSSHHTQLLGKSVSQKAGKLNADYLLAGTLSRGGESLRLTLQLLDADGEILWSDVLAERLVDLSQIEAAAIEALASKLPLPGDAGSELRQVVAACDYPADGDAILAIGSAANLGDHLVNNTDNGLLYLTQANYTFKSIKDAPPLRQPVLQSLATQSLDDARQSCPQLREIELVKIINTRQPITDRNLLARFPNSAELYRRAAANADSDKGALYAEAHALDPTNAETLCYFTDQQPAAMLDEFVPEGCIEQKTN